MRVAGRVFLAWPGPAALDPPAYPDTDAIVLRESIQAVIGDNPQLSQEEERYVQILSRPKANASAISTSPSRRPRKI